MHHDSRIGVQGWRQFLTARREMLDAFDRARVHGAAHEVPVHHGNVAQAVFRDWLVSFLPARFGVCSGYIVSQGASEEDALPHYDVIIYDQLNSPVLWVEKHPDNSKGGASRAIPAEHVRAVIEVKASLTVASAKVATKHLEDLRPLLGADASDERYPRFLCSSFACMSVFFEVPLTKPAAVLDRLIPEEPLRGFEGAFVLRATGDTTDTSCRILMNENGNEPASNYSALSPASMHLPAAYSRMVGDRHRWAFATWGLSLFSLFAFDLVAMVAGTYEHGRVSSRHALRLARPGATHANVPKLSAIPRRVVAAVTAPSRPRPRTKLPRK